MEPTTLNHAITMKGLTPEEFAKVADISVPTIYRALRGQVLRPRSIARIVRALGTTPNFDVPEGLVKSA